MKCFIVKRERELTEAEKAELAHLWECQNYINGLYGYPEHKELIEVISDALGELTRSQCPYCQADIGIDRYLGEDDIEHWLNGKIEKEREGGEECQTRIG